MVTEWIDKNNGFEERTGKLARWPGKESADGLRSEHLLPDCEFNQSSWISGL